MTLSQHPLSAAFPPMAADEYQVLVDSIIEIGIQNPITLYQGMVIDGWHRYTAAMESGLPCPSMELGDVNPRDFVMAQNKARRHITQGQLAMAANAVYQWRPAGRPSANSAGPAELRQAEIADKTGVSVRSLRQASTVEKTAAPEVVTAVKEGKVGLEKAAAIAKLPAAEQAAALHRPAPKPAPQPAPQPEPEPEPDEPDEYTPLDAANEQIADLQADLAIARMGDVPEGGKQHAAELIAELRAEIKTLTATLKATQLSRDSLIEENAQMKRQMAMQRNEIAKLKTPK